MARKKENQAQPTFQSKYNIPEIIMEYLLEFLPEPDDPELQEQTPEENLKLVEDTIFFCASIWNYAALPADCAAIHLQSMIEAIEEAEGDEDVVNMIEEVAADMREQFPDADAIVINHTLEPVDDQVEFGVEIIPLDEGVKAIRAMK